MEGIYRCSLFLESLCGLTAGEEQLGSLLLRRGALLESLCALLEGTDMTSTII